MESDFWQPEHQPAAIKRPGQDDLDPQPFTVFAPGYRRTVAITTTTTMSSDQSQSSAKPALHTARKAKAAPKGPLSHPELLEYA